MDNEVKKLITFNDHDIMMTPREFAYNKFNEIHITGEINSELSTCVNAALRALARVNNNPITIFIESEGGSVSAAFSMYDTAKSLDFEITTVSSGTVASAAAFLARSMASKGRSLCYKNTEFLLHQPRCIGVQGQVTDLRIVAEHGLKQRERLNRILSECTGQTIKKIEHDTERDHWMTAQEALEYGLIDGVIDKYPF